MDIHELTLTTKEAVKKLTHSFEIEVHDKAKMIDPENEHDWYSLTIGWGLGKGLPPNEAIEFAGYIRHETELG
jgi:hypothetical protein